MKEGFFLSKSICIKTNNNKCISYILDEFEKFNIQNTYFSCKRFKNFTNIIIHYTGNFTLDFYSSISNVLTYLVLDLFENNIIKRIINLDYFYFTFQEQKAIFNMCIESLNYEDSLKRFEIIKDAFFNYLKENKKLNLTGFINFRLYNYTTYLDEIIDMCVSKFIIDKEYIEFINLLRSYIKSSSTNSNNIVHLIYKNQHSILLDNNKNTISMNINAFDVNFISDISFSSNDYALNNLLTLLPSKLYIHLIDEEDEFISTLKLIFEDKVYLCHECDICNLYKKTHNITNRIN